MLGYLGRYTHRVALSNDRILSLENGQVTFTYRDRKDKDQLTKEIDRVFSSLSLKAGCNHFTDQIDYNIQRKMVGSHINWWTYEKIAEFLADAGFADIKRSTCGGSEYPPMRDTIYFDSTDIESSVWVEARKPNAQTGALVN